MKTTSGRHLSKIGIGTYGIGGRGHRDLQITERQEDQVYIDALVYTLQQGSNFTEISLGYGHGKALSLFKRALDESAINRSDLFITHSFYPRDLESLDTMRADANDFYRVMQTDYADSTLVTQGLLLRFGEAPVYAFLRELLESGKTRYVSLSNASPNWIRKFHQAFGDRFFAHEGHLSFEIRALQDKGVFATCDELGVTNIIWRPLRRNLTLQNDQPLLSELSAKYQKLPSQVVLNWMCSLGYRPMVFSTNMAHIDQNLSAINFEMSADDYKRMTDFRPENYNPPAVDWEGANIEDDIVLLGKNFEKHITKTGAV